jgi:hypothetical protein
MANCAVTHRTRMSPEIKARRCYSARRSKIGGFLEPIGWLLHTPALWRYTLDQSCCIKLGASFAGPGLLK